MSTEYIMGLGAIKRASDFAAGLEDIENNTTRRAVIAEMQEQLLHAQKAQTALIERIRQLEHQIQRLKQVGPRTDLVRR